MRVIGSVLFVVAAQLFFVFISREARDNLASSSDNSDVCMILIFRHYWSTTVPVGLLENIPFGVLPVANKLQID